MRTDALELLPRLVTQTCNLVIINIIGDEPLLKAAQLLNLRLLPTELALVLNLRLYLLDNIVGQIRAVGVKGRKALVIKLRTAKKHEEDV